MNSAEIERLARDATTSRMNNGNAGESSTWAQQQRAKMMQRKQHQEEVEAGALAATSSGNVDPASMARYDEINQSLRKRTAPNDGGGDVGGSGGGIRTNLLDRIEEDDACRNMEDGSNKRAKMTSGTGIPSSPSASSISGAASASKMDMGGSGVATTSTTTPRRTPRGNGKRSTHKKSRLTTPSSYRKTVALSGGAATPTVVRELFDNKSKSILAELADFDPNTSTSRTLADSIFASGSGISDEEVRKLLTTKASAAAARWELKKQLEASTALIKRLKDMANEFKPGKNKFVAGAVEAERTARAGWARSLHKCKELDGDRTALIKKFAKKKEEEAIILRDNAKDARRDLDISAEKVRSLEGELTLLREKLTAAEKAHSEINIALAVAEARVEEASKQADGWRDQISAIEKSKLELVQKSEVEASHTAEKEATELRQEVAFLKTQMQVREEELGRLIGDSDGSSNDGESQMTRVKKIIEGLRSRICELEADLSLRTSELDKARADCKAADERATAASNDVSELARGIQDVQQSSLTREQEANAAKKDAEEKAAETNKFYTEAQHQLSTLNEEKAKLVEELQSTKNDLSEAEASVQSLKDELAELKAATAGHTSQIEVEKGLRLRAEHAAEEERRERVATSSQMLAMTSEHAKAEAQWRESSQSTERELRRQLEEQAKALQEKEAELRGAKETISCLEGERDSLKSSLTEERSMLEAKNAEQMSQLTGESIRDLLRDGSKGETNHDIKVDKAGNRYVTNLTTQPLDPTDPDAINEVMRLAAKHRAVAATDMNEVSSRSHAVFTLYLRATSEGGQKLCSQLNLVDLAGSERLDRSGATGQRAKEAMSINNSLSSLADVFVSLGNKSSHVPFRNSKLTYLLQPCLSGEGKTLMMVNCSPTDASSQETLNTLRFGSQVNQVELGRAKRQVSTSTRLAAGSVSGTPSSKKRKQSTPLSKWSGSSKRR